MSLIVDEHREYLADLPRVSAFRRAIEDTVQPGHVVLDLGSGTGILGLLACRAGAKRVYSIDEGGMIELAREICRANGFQDRITFIKGLSTRVTLPEPVDIILADQIGHFGFEAGLLEYFTDARKRFLKPGGVTIPSRVDLYVVPVEFSSMWRRVEFWNGAPAGFNFRPARSIAANTGYPVKFLPHHLLGKPAMAASLDPAQAGSKPIQFETDITATRAGTLHGVGGWFSTQLSRTVTLSNSPLAGQRINRRNVFFPIDKPVALQRGDRVRITMHILPADMVVAWTVEVSKKPGKAARHRQDARGARFTHSTLKGMLISQEDLRRTKPDFTPSLTPWGEARRTVLEFCDGKRPLKDIEAEVFHRHPDLFRSLGDAAAFVAEVVTRYAQ